MSDPRRHTLVIAVLLISAVLVYSRPTPIFSFYLPTPVYGVDGPPLRGETVSFRLDPMDPDPVVDRSIRVANTPLPSPVPLPPVYISTPRTPIVGNGMLRWPTIGGRVSQYYSSWHLAIDIAVREGSPVLAAASGVVVYSGWADNGGGIQVHVDHQNGILTTYNHMSGVSVDVGDVVVVGQDLGTVGCTGICTGPHIHFGVKVGGVYVNPLRYL